MKIIMLVREKSTPASPTARFAIIRNKAVKCKQKRLTVVESMSGCEEVSLLKYLSEI